MKLALSIAMFFALLMPKVASAADVIVDKDFCKSIIKAQHIADDGVEYKSGINVDGKSVVPADIGFNPIKNPEPITIPIKLDILERFNINIPAGIITEADMASIQIHQDGKTTYNGQDVSGNIQEYCADKSSIKTQKPHHKKEPHKTLVPEYRSIIEIEELPPIDGSSE